MNQEISISFGAPYLTIQQFARAYGMKEKTVQDWVSKGLLPIRSKSEAGKASITLINNALLTMEAIRNGKTPVAFMGVKPE